MPDRIIRESICTSDTLNQLSDFEERFWHRLIVNCDDFGRFDARPAILKGRLFPLMVDKTLKDMANVLNRLASVGLVELYEVDGRPFLQVTTWDKYQRIRAKRSKFPEPDISCKHMLSNDSKSRRNPIQSESNPMRNAEDEDESACADVVAVVSAYKNKIDSVLSQKRTEELRDFILNMGKDCCLRAIDIALDEQKRSWSYVYGILSKKQEQGVRCLADWDRVEEARQRDRTRQAGMRPGGKYAPPTPEEQQKAEAAAREDMERMRRLLAQQEDGDTYPQLMGGCGND